MTIEEVRSNIRYNEDLIDQFTAEKNGLYNQIEELEALGGKFTNLQTKFGDMQSARQQKLRSFATISNKIFSSYLAGMRDLLSNTEFQNTYDGLSTARGKVRAKIEEIARQISDCEEKIRYRREQAQYWRQQLAALQAEASANG